ncbi:hypothetical protein L3556_01130 [Candidatus Synechococcus calcipolaris G9]|uniref:Uncharacterized protein n=2 Tax=Synechococcus TaxID=1129 RepID=A0ABT6EXA5_9SYNE|nr:hypothetical protein [Candidatus Synechococcus calcipolaris G9]
MFLMELSPLMKELTHKPVAFMGGFVSGLLGLSLDQKPVSEWLEKYGNVEVSPPPSDPPTSGPQSIKIE